MVPRDLSSLVRGLGNELYLDMLFVVPSQWDQLVMSKLLLVAKRLDPEPSLPLVNLKSEGTLGPQL